MGEQRYIRWFEELCLEDVASVGGKNASLGELVCNLTSLGIRVPRGFATTALAYREFVEANGLEPVIRKQVARIGDDGSGLARAGAAIRKRFLQARFPDEIGAAIMFAYERLSAQFQRDKVDVAVRSSATAEDLPDASFAGQQESFLNITGADEVLDACRRCYASLFTDRAIAYRNHHGFDHLEVSLSVGVQKMVRSDLGAAGVMFSIDTESGFPDIVLIDAAWGLGENVVQGAVDPDEYRVFKPALRDESLEPILQKHLGSKRRTMVYAKRGRETTRNVGTPSKRRSRFVLSDQQILTLARWACAIEDHYGAPMDMEWALDGETNELYIVQARPETVQSRREASSLKRFELLDSGKEVLSGLAVGDGIASGRARVILDLADIDTFRQGEVLVTELTGPDWVPIMKKAAAVVTNHGGRTSHAAIVCRELSLPAVVGSGDATRKLATGQAITVSCAEGERGRVYDGEIPFEVTDIDLTRIGKPPVRIMMNIGTPDASLRWWRLPAKGIGLARMEFIINSIVKAHPLALTRFDELEDKAARKAIKAITKGYEDRTTYFVETLGRAVAMIAAAQYPEPVVVRTSDFKTNEYADLIGGRQFEPVEQNPMLGFRGASRYYSDRYRDGFDLECRAIKRAREVIGLDNIVVMIPFVRTVPEADRVLEVLAENGLARGENGLQIYMMCEIPSNVLLADEFASRFDGISIGSNDLTQLILGVDRDSDDLAELFNERDPAVMKAIRSVITDTHRHGTKVSICGQAPSDHPGFAEFLVEAGIDSISLNPDSVIAVIEQLTAAREAAPANA